MIRHLQIKNFKAWADTGKIRMAPITMLFGANSSGKSSIGQFLMLLKQTAESPDRKAVLYPGGKTTAVQLGSYTEMVLHRDPKNHMSFKYEWDLRDPLKFKDPISGKTHSGDAVSFEAEIGLHSENQNSPVLNHLKYAVINPNSADSVTIGMRHRRGTKSDYDVEAHGYTLVRNKGRVWSPKTPYRFYGFPDEVVAYHQNADFVQLINLEHERLFALISYLGPLRDKAQRLYSWTGIEPESVGYEGENTVAAILAARSRKISLGYKRTAKPFEVIIALKLKEMGLIEEFSVNPISEQRQEYEVKVRARGSKDYVDLPDVGFGVSQVLPVLVQCFYAQPRSIILMEQPEIHLHPSAQSALADVMIDVINSKENGVNRNIQLIIETHSEHFLRRLQRRIAEGTVPQEAVSAYFANITKTPARLEPLQIDSLGNIRNWPENFFGDEMGDITAHAKAAMKRHMSQRDGSSEVT